MSAKKLLTLEQDLRLNNPMLPQGSSSSFDAESEMQALLLKQLRDTPQSATELARHGFSGADLVFVLSAALLEAQRNGH